MSFNAATIKIAIDVDGKTGIATIRQVGDESKKSGAEVKESFGDGKKSLGDFNSSAISLSGTVGKLAASFGILTGAAALGGVVKLLNDGVRSTAEFEQRMLRTEAIIRSTGNAAGLSAKDLSKLANQLDLTTLADRDEIMDAINVMQTFRKVSGDVFERAIRDAEDLSSTLGVGVRDQAVQLGKALQDPIQGLTALRRVGIIFTEQQNDQIKSLVKANDLLEAQKIILQEVEKEVGGAAAGAASGLSGKMDTLNYRWREFKENLSDSTGVTKAYSGALEILAKSLSHVSQYLKEVNEASKQQNLNKMLESGIWGDQVYGQAFDIVTGKRNRAGLLTGTAADLFALKTAAGQSLAQQKLALGKGGGDESANTFNIPAWQLQIWAYDATKLGQSDMFLGLNDAKKRSQKVLENQQNQALAEMAKDIPDWKLKVWAYDGQKMGQTDVFQGLVDAHKRAMKMIDDNQQKAFEEANQKTLELTEGTARSIEHTLSDLNFDALTGKLSTFSDYWTAAWHSMAKVMSDVFGQHMAQGLFGKNYKGDGILEGFFNWIGMNASAQGNVFRGPGIGRLENGIYDKPTFFTLARGAGVLAEAGRPEAVMPLVRLPNNDLGVQSAGSPPSIELNIQNSTGIPVEEKNVRIIRPSQGKIIANIELRRKLSGRQWSQ